MMVRRFEVIGSVLNIGRRHHIIRAATASEAWERYERAYAGRHCVMIGTRRLAL